jgi:hypothetical protein
MRPEFPNVDADRVAKKLRAIKPAGSSVSFRRSHPCIVCKRAIGPLGRLLGLGAPTCADEACFVVRPGDVSRCLPTPYGPAVDHSLLSLFARPIHVPSGTLLLFEPLVARSVSLARAYERLIHWQQAYDILEWHRNPDRYQQGIVTLVPPKKLDDVLVLRSAQDLLPRDPTKELDIETAALLRRVVREGEKALAVPF